MTLVLTIAEADEKMRNAGAYAAVSVEFNNEGSHPIGGWGAFVEVYNAMLATRPALCSEIDKARAEVIEAFEAADEKDWLRLHQILGYSAHGKFWRAALIDKVKPALSRLRSLESQLGKEA